MVAKKIVNRKRIASKVGTFVNDNASTQVIIIE